jgi:hypothetical protein
MRRGTCRFCKREIFWAALDGKQMPFDEFTRIFTHEFGAVDWKATEYRGPYYTLHTETCPKARRPKPRVQQPITNLDL